MKNVVVVLLVLILGAVAFVATRPGDYQVERSAVIAAPAEVVHGKLNDFHAWPEWSPWENRDPSMTRTFDGPQSGVGSVYAWAGNDQVGEGRMTILESVPGERVGIQLDFIKPFASTSTTTFALGPSVDGTRVTWTMAGKHNFVSKAMCVFMPMDKMVGPDFEQGLSKLKLVSEAAYSAPADTAAAPGSGG